MKLPIVEFPNDTCSERGLDAIYSLEETHPLQALVWIGMTISVERLLVALHLLCTSSSASYTTVALPAYKAPHALNLWWVVATATSILLIPLTARSKIAVTFKTIHVLIEGSFLAMLARALHRIAMFRYHHSRCNKWRSSRFDKFLRTLALRHCAVR